MSRRQNVIRFTRNEQMEDLARPADQELLQQYERHQQRRGLSVFSIKHDRENLKSILKLVPPGRSLCELTHNEMETFIFDQMRNHRLKPATINGRIKSLRTFTGFLINEGYVLTNEASKVQKIINSGADIPSLSQHQMVVLLRQPDHNTFTGLRDWVIMKLMLDNGIRLREALELQVSQIDLKGRFIRGVIGKNRRCQDVPISKEVCKDLQFYITQRGAVDIGELFITVDNQPLNRRTFQDRMQRYGQMAGIQHVRVSPHTLRHTFAKQWILNGGDVFSLQKILRHSTMDMVRRYVSLWGHEVQQQHDKFTPIAFIDNL